ncbi:hypothetical protein ACEQ8H_007203 [Pleosporales sp. CAS-2024a]
MDHLDDDLDLRYHRGLDPDVYYRCPTLQSLDGALRNELDKNASSLIPVETVTEFVFAAASTLPLAEHPPLHPLIQPAEYLQTITVEQALCRPIDGRDRLNIQRAIARSIVDAIQTADGFSYVERSAKNSKQGGDGARFKYICRDSVQAKKRKIHRRKQETAEDSEDTEGPKKDMNQHAQGYACGGAVHIKFSIKREAVNVVYKHNPIHGSFVFEEILPALALDPGTVAHTTKIGPANGTTTTKKKRKKNDNEEVENDHGNPGVSVSTSPAPPRTLTKTKTKKSSTVTAPASIHKTGTKKSKNGKEAAFPTASRRQTQTREPLPLPRLVKGRVCIRCREKKIKCNEGKPSCDQCNRGLWTCQYATLGAKKRSKNGCINCKAEKRTCTAEQPSCAYCLETQDHCEYAATD